MGGTLVSIAMTITKLPEQGQPLLPPLGRIIVWTEQGQAQAQAQAQAQGITTIPVSAAPAQAAVVAPRWAM